jgi:hypothetical protein
MKWLREPLVQFLLIGAALFGVFALWGGPSTAPAGQYHIVITPGMVQNLIVSYQRQQKRPPTGQELDNLIKTYVKEEIFNREARALGLDQDDTVIRTRLSEKMEFYLETPATDDTPTEDQLEAFLQKNAISFRKPDGTLPTLTAIHDDVRAAWGADQRRQTADAAYQKLLARYTVDVQKGPPATPAASASSATDKK